MRWPRRVGSSPESSGVISGVPTLTAFLVATGVDVARLDVGGLAGGSDAFGGGRGSDVVLIAAAAGEGDERCEREDGGQKERCEAWHVWADCSTCAALDATAR